MSDAKSRLEALKGAFEKKNNTGGGDPLWKLFYQFWKIPEDSTAVVRFLPDLNPDNSLGFLVEKLEHELEIGGNRKKVPCLSMWGEACPICDISRKYYDVEDKEMGKKFYRKKSYIGQVIVVESPIEHDQAQIVKLIDFGPTIFKQIQSAFQSGDLEEAPYELKGGYNFRIKKTKNGEFAGYGTSSFSPKQSDLDDDLIQSLELHDLSTFRGKKPELATVEALLVAALTGEKFDEDTQNSQGQEAAKAPVETKVETKVEAPVETAQASVETKTETAPAATGGKPDLLAQLRARAAAQAAGSAE